MITKLYDTVFEREYEIPENRSLTIGRIEGNGIVIKPEKGYKGLQWIRSRGVSRVHCAINNNSRGVLVADLRSLFGTFVDVEGNGNYVQVGENLIIPVKDCSRIRLGPKTLGYELEVRCGEDNRIDNKGGARLYDQVLNKVYMLPKENLVFLGRTSNSMKLESSKISLPKNKRNIELVNRVSKFHCALEKVNGGFRIRDNRSENGTYVNGRLVDSLEGRLLKHGDLISLGPYVLIFKIGSNGDYDTIREISGKTEGGLENI